MLNLLRSDFYRCTRLRGFRGALWQYLSVILGVAILEVGLNAFIISQGLGELEAINVQEALATPSVFLGSAMLGSISLVGIASAFGMVEWVFADLNDGYVKSLVSSLSGRLSYFAEKVAFSGIWAAIMIAGAVVFHLACMQLLLFLPLGLSYLALDGGAEFALWLLGTWLAVWALTVIPLCAVLLIRKKLPAYTLTFVLIMGVVPVVLTFASNMGTQAVPRSSRCSPPSPASPTGCRAWSSPPSSSGRVPCSTPRRRCRSSAPSPRGCGARWRALCGPPSAAARSSSSQAGGTCNTPTLAEPPHGPAPKSRRDPTILSSSSPPPP